jgi:hypothetical protein
LACRSLRVPARVPWSLHAIFWELPTEDPPPLADRQVSPAGTAPTRWTTRAPGSSRSVAGLRTCTRLAHKSQVAKQRGLKSLSESYKSAQSLGQPCEFLQSAGSCPPRAPPGPSRSAAAGPRLDTMRLEISALFLGGLNGKRALFSAERCRKLITHRKSEAQGGRPAPLWPSILTLPWQTLPTSHCIGM